MKNVFLILLLASGASYAQDYQVTTESGGIFRMHNDTVRTTVRDGVTFVSAYWTLTSAEKMNYRMKVEVSGCEFSTGQINLDLLSLNTKRKDVWIADGPAMYDHIAEVQCTKRLVKKTP